MSVHESKLKSTNRSLGFTFLEVLIVMAIIAILAAVAYPSYLSYIVRANRVAAEGFLLEVANRQERYLLDNRGYAANIGVLTTAGLVIPSNVSQNYTITTTSGASPPSYTVFATPQGNQLARDTDCGTLSIDSTGAKTPLTPASCWRQ